MRKRGRGRKYEALSVIISGEVELHEAAVSPEALSESLESNMGRKIVVT